MATFRNLPVYLDKCEFRGYRSDVSKKTRKTWMQAIFERPEDLDRLECSVPEEMQSEFFGGLVVKGVTYDIELRVSANADYASCSLASYIEHEDDSTPSVAF